MISQVLSDSKPMQSSQKEISETATTDCLANDAYVQIGGVNWFAIADSHLQDEFFTTLISANDHWMFISSVGALTAGRGNANSPLFPYYPSDKISDLAATTGPLTILRIAQADGSHKIWRPFAQPVDQRGIRRNVYKNVAGNRLMLEETRDDLPLVFRYQWSFGESAGFVRTCELVSEGTETVSISLLDGLQNLMPSGLEQAFQLQYSNLSDAYRKNERLPEANIGVYYLSSIPTDRAQPNEGLRATTVWQTGLENVKTLLSTDQVQSFVTGGAVHDEDDRRGCRGAYLVKTEIELPANQSKSWHVVADVDQDRAAITTLRRRIVETEGSSSSLEQFLSEDMDLCEREILAIASSADGRQSGSDRRAVHRHQSNVIYNVMRGGLPADNYQIDLRNFLANLQIRNSEIYVAHRQTLEGLGETVSLSDLIATADRTGDADLIRLTQEYLPLTFSRRHGDPSRPWNKFSINLTNPDGSQRIAWEGNWRDIFQNWEAIAASWPDYTPSMICRFLGASTADGYNPYRITHEGVEWEEPEEDAFTNIGYWGDHQIVYLWKLLNWSRQANPGQLDRLLSSDHFAYADVPYRIASYDQILVDASDTIEYDVQKSKAIEALVDRVGTDGKLLRDSDGMLVRASMLEKLLVPILAKMTNFVPGGGIWLNTQRPEWNDANNALVGNGMSVVTACYLRRYLAFLCDWFDSVDGQKSHQVSTDVWTLARRIEDALAASESAEGDPSQQRQLLVDALSRAGSDYRDGLYERGLSADRDSVSLAECSAILNRCRQHLDQCIAENRRADGLYHAYNLMQRSGDRIEIEHLTEMLEGQVAAISSGLLTGEQTCDMLDALRNSRLYREDQDSYMLYPDRQTRRFFEKNSIDEEALNRSDLLKTLLEQGDRTIVTRDADGQACFHADLHNAQDLAKALDDLAANTQHSALVDRDRTVVGEVYEQTFGHRHFTGRSENFFAYEGLGSIYWHMVSKLALATLEQFITESKSGCDPETLSRLASHYRAVRDGLGVNKSPAHYGAFPTDPYSHTPSHRGAQQPGMTGQVKEDVLCRLLELGMRLNEGCASLDMSLFETAGFHKSESTFEFINLTGDLVSMNLVPGTFAWTWCQVPVVYHHGDNDRMEVHFADGNVEARSAMSLTHDETAQLFSRTGDITQIDVYFDADNRSFAPQI